VAWIRVPLPRIRPGRNDARRQAAASTGTEPTWATRLFGLAFVANALDLALSYAAILRFGLQAEANPVPLMAWGWSHGLIGAIAVKAALLAIVVAAAAMHPHRARPLLYLVAIAGIAGAISAFVVL
jgi:hypothetical protein